MPIITVFRSRLRPESLDDYRTMATRMDELARSMPGFLDAKSFTADDGERVTLVTFADQASQRAWREHPEHREAQRAGRGRFYVEYSLQVGEVGEATRFSHE